MRTIFATTVALALLAAALIQPARAQQDSSIMTVRFGSSQVELDNKSDASIIETAYDTTGIIKHAAKSWCVVPHTVDKHAFTFVISQVRVQVMRASCAGPVALDRTLQMQGPGAFVISGRSGHYSFVQK